MIGSNPRPYLKAWGVPVETVEMLGGEETKKQILGIVSAPGREVNFGGVVVVSDDYVMVYATADATLIEGGKISVMAGPDMGDYLVREVTRSADGVFSNAKLAKIQ